MTLGGSIILTASIAGSKSMEALGVYAVTKAAISAFARSWTSDLKGKGISANVISPGPIDTPGLGGLAHGESEAVELKANLASMIPLGRLGKPEEIAKAAVFLASDDASFVSGIETLRRWCRADLAGYLSSVNFAIRRNRLRILVLVNEHAWPFGSGMLQTVTAFDVSGLIPGARSFPKKASFSPRATSIAPR
jgi:hypothetical protein